MKYHFNADNHALTRVIALVNGFGSAIFTEIATFVAGNSYSSR